MNWTVSKSQSYCMLEGKGKALGWVQGNKKVHIAFRNLEFLKLLILDLLRIYIRLMIQDIQQLTSALRLRLYKILFFLSLFTYGEWILCKERHDTA